MKKLSVDEYAKLIGVTPKTVYRRIEKGQVITCKDIVNNKEVTRVIVDDDEMLNSDMTNTCQRQMTNDDMTSGNNPSIPISTVTQGDKFLDLIKQMYEDNKHLSEYAGQIKLLTDSENKTKEEYFKVVQENAQLKAKLDLQQKQLEELKEKLKSQETSKNNNWWSKL